MRPPQRSRASTMVTLLPARASSRAVIRPAAPAPTIRKFAGCSGAIMLGDIGLDLVLTGVGGSATEAGPWHRRQGLGGGRRCPRADWSWCRSGRRALMRGAERANLAGGVLQLRIAQLRRHLVLLGQRQQSAEPQRLFKECHRGIERSLPLCERKRDLLGKA